MLGLCRVWANPDQAAGARYSRTRLPEVKFCGSSGGIMRNVLWVLVVATCSLAHAQNLSPEVKEFVKVDAPVVALEHVRVIDGTGAAATDDQTVVLANGKIQSVSPATEANPPAGAKVLDLQGYSVIPGLVGMHDHM